MFYIVRSFEEFFQAQVHVFWFLFLFFCFFTWRQKIRKFSVGVAQKQPTSPYVTYVTITRRQSREQERRLTLNPAALNIASGPFVKLLRYLLASFLHFSINRCRLAT